MKFINNKIATEVVESHFRKLAIQNTAGKYKLKTTKFTTNIQYDYLSTKTGLLGIHDDIKKDKSKLLIYVIMDDEHPSTWVIKAKTLINFIKDNEPVKHINGFNLYKLEEILLLFDRLDNLPEKEALKIIRKNLK